MSVIRNLQLAKAAFVEQARAERAHLGNFWFTLISKLAYNTMFLLFIDQLYARVGRFADYSKNDFLFMYLVSQLGFYICYYGIFFALSRLVQIVRNGSFDLLLLKPVPQRAFMYISGMQPYDMILTAIPSITILVVLINWGALNLSVGSLLLGLVVWVSGIIICNTIVFAMALPVFIGGEASDTINSFYSVTQMSQIPYSKLPLGMKIAALGLFPQIIIAGASTEVMLMKVDMLGITLLLAATSIVSIIVVQLMWRFALRNYTSVSS